MSVLIKYNQCMSKMTLSSKQREIFSKTTESAFANPFSKRRAALDREIVKLFGFSASGEKPLDIALAKIRAMLREMTDADVSDPAMYAEPDKGLLTFAILFDLFHAYMFRIDNHIEKQVAAGSELCEAEFAIDLMADLCKRGFNRERSSDYVAFFFQMRRAFFFLSKELTGGSDLMRQVRSALWDNVFGFDLRVYEKSLYNRMEDFSTLLLGETGTGKGAAARAIGMSGFIPYDIKKKRFAESFMSAFVSINLSEYVPSLIESELFGHRQGAFTGARDRHKGVFSQCSPHGSIFLDEIGDVSEEVQVKLLRVMQDRVFRPVGSHEYERFSGRVIAATNKNVDDLLEEAHMRQDFFYRISSDIIHLPSLRNRIQDDASELDLLIRGILIKILGGEDESLFSDIRSRIRESVGDDYAWPGNVRELEQCIRRIILHGKYEIRNVAGESRKDSFLFNINPLNMKAQNLLAQYCKFLHERFGTYEDVARAVHLDRRTVKKYVQMKIEE